MAAPEEAGRPDGALRGRRQVFAQAERGWDGSSLLVGE